MSLFSSMATAVSGMNAQSRALSNISDNVANSQTIGFKRVDTAFEDLLAQTNGRSTNPGAVAASSEATVSLQGSLETVENPLAIALSGNGLFSVARPVGKAVDGSSTFDAQQLFTRAGDFSKNSSGYLVNTSGYALQGWAANADGDVQQGVLTPIRVDEKPVAAQATTKAALVANLPTSSGAADSASSQFQVYNAAGDLKTVQLSWARTSATSWSVTAKDGGTNTASTSLTFDPTTGIATNGSRLDLNWDLGGGVQPIALDLSGVTQKAGTAYQQTSMTVDGTTGGYFRSVAIRDGGDIVASYDNGTSRLLGRVPVITFVEPNALQRVDGQAFAATVEAGTMRVQEAGTKGAGEISASALEHSNVDIAAEFTKLIVAQRAYTANTRIVTTTDQMLEETINMRR